VYAFGSRKTKTKNLLKFVLGGSNFLRRRAGEEKKKSSFDVIYI
jgi:hypothetical protein